MRVKSVEAGIKNPHKTTFAKIFYVDFTKFRGKSVEKGIKNPHKMTFAKIFCVDFTKFRGESVETGVKNPHKTNFFFQKCGKRGRLKTCKPLKYNNKMQFPHFPRFSKTFRSYISQKIF